MRGSTLHYPLNHSPHVESFIKCKKPQNVTQRGATCDFCTMFNMNVLQRYFCSAAYSTLFALHVMLKVFDFQVWSTLSRWMFYFGKQLSKGEGRQLKLEVIEETCGPKPTCTTPFVIRGFFHSVTVEELMEDIYAIETPRVLTHSYSPQGELTEETMSLRTLVGKIRDGSTANAKSIILRGADHFLSLSGLKAKVDSLRGTDGMPWKELAMQFHVGGIGTLTRCHADPSLNCYLQLCGRKRWRIAPPSSACGLAVLPRGDNISYNSHLGITYQAPVDWQVVDLHPGDLLVLPPFYFHEVTNLAGEPVVVGLAMNWLSFNHAIRQSWIMTAGAFMRPRLWKRFLSSEPCSVDEEIMRSCREVCSCSVGLPEEKVAVMRSTIRKAG